MLKRVNKKGVKKGKRLHKPIKQYNLNKQNSNAPKPVTESANKKFLMDDSAFFF